MPFYEFRQNNSGGQFHGPQTIIVEATDAAEANERAEINGVYFDGCDDGRDCRCCGDRWYRASEGDREPSPPWWRWQTEEEILAANPAMVENMWFLPNTIKVVFENGTVKTWTFTDEHRKKAKAKMSKKRAKLYGFEFHPAMILRNQKVKVRLYVQNDELETYWDSSGNSEVQGLGWNSGRYDNGVESFGATTKAEAVAVADELNSAIDRVYSATQSAFSRSLNQEGILKKLRIELEKI